MHDLSKSLKAASGLGLALAFFVGCRTPAPPASPTAPASPTTSLKATPPSPKASPAPKASPPSPFGPLPGGLSPREIGKRVAENFAARPLGFETDAKRDFVIYPEVCAWYGALAYAQLAPDQELKRKLIAKFDPLLSTEARRISPSAHVDFRVFGVVPLELYRMTKDPKYLKLGKKFADLQWDKTTSDGISTEARYWIDDMFMITALQVQAYRATGEAKYVDRAALTMSTYLDRLQQTNGLFLHAADSPFYWSRGNGWVAAGMTELLQSLPLKNPHRTRILEGYRRMMVALLGYQAGDGLWRQLIDHPESWPETSGTSMFTFAMVTGVNQGWLDARTYGPAARRAWIGLVPYLDKDANLSNVCEGTPKGYNVQYYLDRRRNIGDLHGQAPLLWTATALMR
jgi:unsaturated rhamnogalacturonyl hydrolase